MIKEMISTEKSDNKTKIYFLKNTECTLHYPRENEDTVNTRNKQASLQILKR